MEKIICLRLTVIIFQGREDVRMELEKKRGDTYRKELDENEELKRQLTAKNRCDHNEQIQMDSWKSFYLLQSCCFPPVLRQRFQSSAFSKFPSIEKFPI